MTDFETIAKQFAILDHMPVGAFVLREDFVVIFWNSRLEDWTGIPRQTILGQPLTAHFPHLAAPSYTLRIQDVFNTGMPFVFSPYLHKYIIPIRLPDKHSQVQATTLTRVPDQSGLASYVLFSIQDITELAHRIRDYRLLRDQAQREVKERQQAERALQKANVELQQRVNELSKLNLISQTTVTAHDLQTLLELTTYTMTELFTAHSVGIALLNETQTELTVRAYYSQNIYEPACIGRSLSLQAHAFLTQVVASRSPLIVPDVAVNPLACAAPKQTPFVEIAGLLLVPLLTQREVIGVLVMDTDQAGREFTANEITLAGTFAGQIVGALENARLFAEECRQRQVVEQRTQELSQTLEHLRAAQQELIQSEKMAALGQLIAGVAHEINTPLSAIRSSIGNIADTLEQTLAQLPAFFQSLSAGQQKDFFALLHRALHKKTVLSSREEREVKQALSETLRPYNLDNPRRIGEKLVKMGVLTDIQPFLALLQDANHAQIIDLAYRLAGLHESTQTITTAVNKASKVVFALRSYAHCNYAGELVQADLIEGIETVLTLYQNQLKHGVEVIRQYEKLPPIWCYPDELNQVWTNLIQNALQAMDYKGALTIAVHPTLAPSPKLGEGRGEIPPTLAEVGEGAVAVLITDTGAGIPEAIKTKIFEPFFTTKPAGEGSGLGLDIVRKILEKHHGTIGVESTIGQGTTFTITLPTNPATQTTTRMEAAAEVVSI